MLSFFSWSNIDEISSEYVCSSYIVYDGLTDNILESNNIDVQRSVASISKIMTAILVIEYGFVDEFITVGDWINKVDGSSVYLYVGEVICVRELLYGLMLRSGNDCAMTLAMFVSGNVSSFVDRMNNKAKEIGMNNTIFMNPSGLDSDDGGNLSTAYDMALLCSYAMKNKLFRDVVSSKEYKSTNHGVWKNKNKLLTRYKYAIGGKTGYTKMAKRTLVSVAKKDDTELIVVTLNCGDDFNFHISLYEKWFSKYKTYLAISKGYNYVDEYEIYCNDDVYVRLSDKTVINYHLKPSGGVMDVGTSNDNKLYGTCQINRKLENKKKVSWFSRLKEMLFSG